MKVHSNRPLPPARSKKFHMTHLHAIIRTHQLQNFPTLTLLPRIRKIRNLYKQEIRNFRCNFFFIISTLTFRLSVHSVYIERNINTSNSTIEFSMLNIPQHTYIETNSMLCIYSTIYIEFDLRNFDLKMTQIHIHRKPIRRIVFSVISVFYGPDLTECSRCLGPSGWASKALKPLRKIGLPTKSSHVIVLQV